MDAVSENQRKRKSYFGSAEKSRKYNKNASSSTTSMSKDDFMFNPNITSSGGEKYGNDKTRFERKDQEIKSRRRLPLSETNINPSTFSNKPKAIAVPIEKDERKLATRQRQIDIGKNTVGYQKYLEDIKRLDRTKEHPWTPNKYNVCSTRSWQGMMRIWRRKLHFWDPPSEIKEEKDAFFDSSINTIPFDTKPIDNSMDADECFSGSSQASSTEEYNNKVIASWYDSDDETYKEDNGGNHLYRQCGFDPYF